MSGTINYQGYAIVMEKVMVSCVTEGDGVKEHTELSRGMMVEFKRNTDRYCTVVVRDYYQSNLAFQHNLYLCKLSALYPVPSDIWPFLIAINDPIERAVIAKEKPFVDYILSLNIESMTTVNGQYFQMSTVSQSLSSLPERERQAAMALDYHVVVKYIGPVYDIGPGHLLGLQLLVNL